jgi:hypothetical protein
MPVVNVGANCGSLDNPLTISECVYSYSAADNTNVLRVKNGIAYINNFTGSTFDTGPSTDEYLVTLAWDATMDVTKVRGFTSPTEYTKFIKGDPRVRYIYSRQEITDLGSTSITYTNGGTSNNLKRPLVILKDVDNISSGFFLIGAEPDNRTDGTTVNGGGAVDTTIRPNGSPLVTPVTPSWNVTLPSTYVAITSTTYVFLKRDRCLPPTVNYTASCWFRMNSTEYNGSSVGKKQYFLTSDGTVYDINQPIADITKPWKFSLQISQDTTNKKYVTTAIPPSSWQSGAAFSTSSGQTSNSLRVSGSSVTGQVSVTIIASGEFPATSIVFDAITDQPTQTSDVVDGLSENTIFTCINSPINPVVMGWCSASTATGQEDNIRPTAPYKFKTRKSYFSFMPFGPKQGYFNLIPVTSESLAPPSTASEGYSGQYFFMFSGDNAQMFLVNASGTITSQPTPNTFYRQDSTGAGGSAVPGSLMASTSIRDVYKYGVWRFVNIQDADLPKQTFALSYTPPVQLSSTSPGSTQSLNPLMGSTGATYYVKYDGGVITNGTVMSYNATSTATSTGTSTFTSTGAPTTSTFVRLPQVGNPGTGSTFTSTVPGKTSTFIGSSLSASQISTVAKFTCTTCTITTDSGGACFPGASVVPTISIVGKRAGCTAKRPNGADWDNLTIDFYTSTTCTVTYSDVDANTQNTTPNVPYTNSAGLITLPNFNTVVFVQSFKWNGTNFTDSASTPHTFVVIDIPATPAPPTWPIVGKRAGCTTMGLGSGQVNLTIDFYTSTTCTVTYSDFVISRQTVTPNVPYTNSSGIITLPISTYDNNTGVFPQPFNWDGTNFTDSASTPHTFVVIDIPATPAPSTPTPPPSFLDVNGSYIASSSGFAGSSTTTITISNYTGGIGKIQTVTRTSFNGGTNFSAPQCDFTLTGTTLIFSNTGLPNTAPAQGIANPLPITYNLGIGSAKPTLTSTSGTVYTKQ